MADRKSPLRADPRFQKLGDLPSWLQVKIRVHLDVWRENRATLCMHSPMPTSSVPVRMAAWKPTHVVCTGCAHLLSLSRHNPETNRCDCCDRLTEGTDDDHVYSAQVSLPGLTYEIGVCLACRVGMA